MKLSILLGLLLLSSISPMAQDLRFLETPSVTQFPGGALEWNARIACPSSVTTQIARLLFLYDRKLDGAADAADTVTLPFGDCIEGVLDSRRVFTPPFPALLQVELQNAEGISGGAHGVLTAGGGSLLSIHRYCARPKDGEPEWIEILNNSAVSVSLQHVRVQGRALADAGSLAPGESLTAGRDTVPLRVWRPGGRLFGTGTWSNLRNAGDTLHLSFADEFLLDSLAYGAGYFPREACASLDAGGDGGNTGAAFGYSLDVPVKRWSRRRAPLTFTVRAPDAGRYDLRVYDLDGMELCVLARNAVGSADFTFPSPGCGTVKRRDGAVLLLLRPRGVPAVRTVIRITE